MHQEGSERESERASGTDALCSSTFSPFDSLEMAPFFSFASLFAVLRRFVRSNEPALGVFSSFFELSFVALWKKGSLQERVKKGI